MFEIRYSDDFYVNTFPNREEEYAKGHIEAFMKKMPRKLADYLTAQNHFGNKEPEFQAVIIGEPMISMFGKSQVAVVMVHSNFVAYTTAVDYKSPINRTYGYATFDNKLSVMKVMDHLEMKSAYETLVVGYGTESLSRDYEVIHKLLEKNSKAVERYYREKETMTVENDSQRLPADESSKSLLEADAETNQVADEKDDEKLSAEQPEEFVSEEEWVRDVATETTLSADQAPAKEILTEGAPTVENRLENPTENANPVEEKGVYPMREETETNVDETISENEETITKKEEQPEEGYHFNVPEEKKEPIVDTSRIDSRFSAETLIISNDSIPYGFIFKEPVIYAYSVRPGIFKTATPRKGYIQAYETCLDMIRDDIADGLFDAVFNLQFSAQSVDNYYEVIMTGDAVVYQKEV